MVAASLASTINPIDQQKHQAKPRVGTAMPISKAEEIPGQKPLNEDYFDSH